MIHVMLDLETWGTEPGCDIRSIGAVVFDPLTGEVSIPCRTCEGGTTRGNVNDGGDCSDCMNTRMESGYGDTFYQVVSGGEQYGLVRDPNTVEWWDNQSEEARSAFAKPVHILRGLNEFSVWYGMLGNPAEVTLWCNGPHFDEVILKAVYKACEAKHPWHYRAPRDFRTIMEAAGWPEVKAVGTYHNALDDAITQAIGVIEAYRILKG